MELIATPDAAVVWKDNQLFLLDQRLLPETEVFIQLSSSRETAQAITDMVVRGAPAIGVTAAYGVVLAAREAFLMDARQWKQTIEPLLDDLALARPTAINLHWALARMKQLIVQLPDGDPENALIKEAQLIHSQDIESNVCLSDIAADLMQGCGSVITHCNAGALATGGYGTALGVIKSAFRDGKVDHVYADETRPWFQGSRLTAWELEKSGIPCTVMVDSVAATLMAQSKVSWVIVGSDRIAANGDVANKIGTYSLIVNAKFHGVKVMVAAPSSTIAMNTATGADIPIELRGSDEVMKCGGKQVGVRGVDVLNPVFDVTPAALIDVIVTEKGAIFHPSEEKIKALMLS